MKVLLLGAGGMLGHALVNEFAGDEIIVGDLPEFDITNFKEIKDKLQAIQPEVIINAAAYTNVDGCETNAELCNLVNGEAVGNLASISKELGIILVHYSTDYVFTGNNENGYAEEAQTNPLNIYGQSKELGEQLLMKNTDKYYLIRTAWLYGNSGKNFVDTIIELSGKNQQIPVVNDQFGNPTYAKDLAAATRRILIDKKPAGIYHQTNKGSCSWYEFALKIKELKGFKAEITPVTSKEFERRAKRPKYSKLINAKLPPLRHWVEALADYLKRE